VEIGVDGSDHHLARVEAHSNLHLDRKGTPYLIGVAADRRLHVKGRITGTHRVIFVGDRCTEECHDPITYYSVDGALVVVDGIHHTFEDGVEELPRLLGVATSQQLHRAAQVGE
jgi:hypothetical protein